MGRFYTDSRQREKANFKCTNMYFSQKFISIGANEQSEDDRSDPCFCFMRVRFLVKLTQKTSKIPQNLPPLSVVI